MKLEIMEKYFQMESLDELHNEFKSDFYNLVEEKLTVDEVSIIKDYYENKKYNKIRIYFEDALYIAKNEVIRAVERSIDVAETARELHKWQPLDNMFSEFMNIRYNLLSK